MLILFKHYMDFFVLFTEKYTPQRSGLRERKRVEEPRQTEPSLSEAWMPEETLDLWEIKVFGDK